eukprot:CAMPEP_0168402418 /NCGR_PEP_ID=MMETSP0228-20121227/23610_1 /TAXON_ID=133427 /ORGANISM="Protoceratium reticulatum, Strain CCCM 535 (=CCMP 1889)" /LENGTH=328 /DNA_ID=CAMNT_0008416003 /DNA_START=46 /DNA_END=1029 /DNA_ORIENTATION=+
MGNCHCSSGAPETPVEDLVLSPEQEKEATPKPLVLIQETRHLRKAGWFPGVNASACYCTLRIAGTEKDMFKTKVRRDQVEPTWSQEVEVEDYVAGDALEFTIWDSYSGKEKLPEGSENVLVGKAFLESTKFETCGFNGELEVENVGKGVVAYLKVKVSMDGRGYPAGPPMDFYINVGKDLEEDLGTDFDTQDDTIVQVMSVQYGLFDSYNGSVKPIHQIRSGDFIAEANGVKGDAMHIIKVMRQEANLRLWVKRPMEICVAINKGEKKAPLGMEFPQKPTGNCLLVLRLTPGGPVMQWNEQHPNLAVRRGDRIIAVECREGKPADLLK